MTFEDAANNAAAEWRKLWLLMVEKVRALLSSGSNP